MLQFLCLQMCVYGGGVVPQGGVGDRHLVTIPQGVVGDRLPWGGEQHGGVRVVLLVHCCALQISGIQGTPLYPKPAPKAAKPRAKPSAKSAAKPAAKVAAKPAAQKAAKPAAQPAAGA